MSLRFIDEAGRALLVLLLVVVSARGQVVINEIGTGTVNFVELRNIGPGSINLSGWVVNTYSGTSLIQDLSFAFPVLSLPAGGFIVVEEGGSPNQGGQLPASIATGINVSWEAGTPLEVVLFDSTGRCRDYMLRRGTAFVNAVHRPADGLWLGVGVGGSGTSTFRVKDHDTDRSDDWMIRADLSTSAGTLNPGQLGVRHPHERVMITEVSWGDPDGLEITNFGSDPVPMTDWTVTWKDQGNTHVSLPLGITMLPGETILVMESGAIPIPSNTRRLDLFFSIPTTSSAFCVALKTGGDVVVDEVRISSAAGAPPTFNLGGVFIGTVLRGTVTGTTANVSVERAWGLDSDTADDWFEQTRRSLGRENLCDGPRTPPPPFTSVPSLVISEIDDEPDLIEIMNTGTQDVNLQGFFLLCTSGQGALTSCVTPFVNRTIVPAGGFVVLGEAPVVAELPPQVPYLRIDGNSNFGQNIPFTGGELACALYTARGQLIDMVRATRLDSELVVAAPSLPGPPRAFAGAARRTTTAPGSARFGRITGAPDSDTGADWFPLPARTMGLPNAQPSGPAGLGDPLDVRLNPTGRGRGLALLINGDPSFAGFGHHLAFSVGHAFGWGPILGLGPDAVGNTLAIFGAPPWSGTLNGSAAARIDIDPGTLPPGIDTDNIVFVVDPSGTVVARTVVMPYDS
jgi:hypothetical protein